MLIKFNNPFAVVVRTKLQRKLPPRLKYLPYCLWKFEFWI